MTGAQQKTKARYDDYWEWLDFKKNMKIWGDWMHNAQIEKNLTGNCFWLSNTVGQNILVGSNLEFSTVENKVHLICVFKTENIHRTVEIITRCETVDLLKRTTENFLFLPGHHIIHIPAEKNFLVEK